MEAKELRIGNWIFYMNEYTPVEVGGVDGKMIYSIGDWSLINEHKPIPLTEERLERFGFEANVFNWRLGEFRIYVKEGGYTVMFRGIVITRSLKYAHQLQNIYFALKSEELTVKELA